MENEKWTVREEPVDYLDLDFPTYEICADAQYWIAHTQKKEHAARIVQCVNSHDALVEALELALLYANIVAQEDSERGLRARKTVTEVLSALAAAGELR